ncbi:MAG: hypothetical protein ABSA83_14930 [Verrucomicrobiota bacterium]|jgi:hypothetical protein
MKRIAFSFSLVFLVISSVRAQETTYDWTGTGGFTAMITLNSPASSDGNLNDIVSVYAQDPAGFGPFATYPVTVNYGFGSIVISPETFDSSDAVLTGQFAWNSSKITEMDLQWTLGGDVWYFDAGPLLADGPRANAMLAGSSIEFQNGDAELDEYDNTGIYAAGPASAPDAGSTILLFGFALAGMSLCSRRQPVPAKVIARRPSR